MADSRKESVPDGLASPGAQAASAQTSPPPKVGLYGGLFQGTDAENQQQLEALSGSGFNTIVFWSLHVMPSGTLVLNGKPLTVNDGVVSWQLKHFAPLIQGLRAGGVDNVLFSIGSGSSDFEHMRALLATPQGKETLTKNFNALMDALPIDGFDYDLEYNGSCGQYTHLTQTVVELSLLFQSYGSGYVTFCPFNCEDFWLNCMAEIVEKNQQWTHAQAVQWWNLQTYGPYVSPAAWAQAMTTYGVKKLGITDPSAFIAPGYSIEQLSQPSDLQTAVEQQGVTGGAWIWNSGYLFESAYAPSDWAHAIINGLNAAKTSGV